MSLINLLTSLLVKAYLKEAERHRKQSVKSAEARRAFQEEAEEYRQRAIDAELAASECLAVEADSLKEHGAHLRKAEEVERFFTV